jgi:hypothetical protein
MTPEKLIKGAAEIPGVTVVPLDDAGAFYVVADSWVEKLRRSGGDEEVIAHFEEILGSLMPKPAAAKAAARAARERGVGPIVTGLADAVRRGSQTKGAHRIA